MSTRLNIAQKKQDENETVRLILQWFSHKSATNFKDWSFVATILTEKRANDAKAREKEARRGTRMAINRPSAHSNQWVKGRSKCIFVSIPKLILLRQLGWSIFYLVAIFTHLPRICTFYCVHNPK